MTKGSDLLVAALENEGVDRIFGVPGEENLDVVESLRTSRIELVVTRHEQAAGFMAATHGRLTGQARRLHLDAWARRAQLLDRGGLCPSRRHADDHDHRAEGDHERQAGAVPDRRRHRLDEAADQDDAADRQRPQHPDRRSRCLPGCDGRASGPGASGASRGRRGDEDRVRSADSGASARTSGRPSRRHRSRGRDDPGGQASADHDRRGRQSSAAGRAAVRLRAAQPHSVLQHADGQGRRQRRLEPLCRNGGAFRARLCARCDRRCRT